MKTTIIQILFILVLAVQTFEILTQRLGSLSFMDYIIIISFIGISALNLLTLFYTLDIKILKREHQKLTMELENIDETSS